MTTMEHGIFLCFGFYAMVRNMNKKYEQLIVMSFKVVFDFNSVSSYVFNLMWNGTQTKYMYAAADIL